MVLCPHSEFLYSGIVLVLLGGALRLILQRQRQAEAYQPLPQVSHQPGDVEHANPLRTTSFASYARLSAGNSSRVNQRTSAASLPALRSPPTRDTRNQSARSDTDSPLVVANHALIHAQHLTRFDHQSSFFARLTRHRFAQSLSAFEDAARQRPLAQQRRWFLAGLAERGSP